MNPTPSSVTPRAATPPLRNWARTLTFTPTTLHRPTSVDAVRALVADAAANGRHARVLGSGHSFSPVADTTGTFLTVADLPPQCELDSATGEVRIAAGMTYGAVGAWLQERGRALFNTGSLPHISVAGACATGTHGSGSTNRVLATAVTAVDLVGADGDLVHLTRGHDAATFPGAVLALGLTGVVVGLTLATEPTYQVRQDVWRDVTIAALADAFEATMSAGYSVSLFTDWRGDTAKVWVKRRTDALVDLPPDWLGGRLDPAPAHPIDGEDARAATEQGSPGPWNARLPHFRMEFTPSSGDEVQSEYLLDRADAPAALAALHAAAPRFAPALQVCEVRTIAADDLWLSPCHGRDTVALHFTWVSDPAAVAQAVAAVEAAIADLDPRPHWGKVFALDPDIVAARTPGLADFRRLVAGLDPRGVFGNAFTARYVTG